MHESEVAQSCLTLSNHIDCSLPASSIHGVFQARVLEWGAIAFSSVKCYRFQVGGSMVREVPRVGPLPGEGQEVVLSHCTHVSVVLVQLSL